MEQKTVMGPKKIIAINSWVTGVGGGGIGGIISFNVLDPFQLSSIELVDKRGNQKV